MTEMKSTEKKNRSRKGFTLAELLIVVAVIAVLVFLAVMVFGNSVEKSREATDLANLRSAYAEISVKAMTADAEIDPITVVLEGKESGWTNTKAEGILQGLGSVDGQPAEGGSCEVSWVAAENKVLFKFGAGSGSGTGPGGGSSNVNASGHEKVDLSGDIISVSSATAKAMQTALQELIADGYNVGKIIKVRDPFTALNLDTLLTGMQYEQGTTKYSFNTYMKDIVNYDQSEISTEVTGRKRNICFYVMADGSIPVFSISNPTLNQTVYYTQSAGYITEEASKTANQQIVIDYLASL